MSRRTIDWRLRYRRRLGDMESVDMVWVGAHEVIRDFRTEYSSLREKGAWWFIEGDITMCILTEMDPPAAQWKKLT